MLEPELVRCVVRAYTRPGDLVAVTSGTGQAASTIETLQRRCVGLAIAPIHGTLADLVLMAPRLPWTFAPPRIADQLRAGGRALRPGGLVVVVIRPGCRVRGSAAGCRPGDTVRAAQRAGFGYLQHNVAVHAPIGGDGLLPTAPRCVRTTAAVGGLPVHRVVHSDVLVFTAPGSAGG